MTNTADKWHLPRIEEILAEFDFRVAGKWVLYGVSVGLLAGGGVLLLYAATNLVLHGVAQLTGAEQHWDPAVVGEATHGVQRWLWASLAIVGALVSGVLTTWIAPEAAGNGLEEVLRQYHFGDGTIRRRTGWVKVGASAVVIGTGGSGGMEGPAGLVGAAFVRYIARLYNLSVRDRRTLIVAGAGAGIGAAFQTPLGGAIFAAEMLYSEPEFESDAVVPSLIASIVSYSTVRFVMGEHAIFHVPQGLGFNHPLELVAYAGLAFVIVVVSWLYAHFYRDVVVQFFEQSPLPRWLRPAVGAVVTGVIIAWQPLVAGGGYRAVDLTLAEALSLGTLLQLLVLKMLATAFTIGSGGSGGTFAPTVMMGTVLGAAVGILFHQFGFVWAADVPAFAVVGMGGMFAAISKVPLAMIVMTAELTRGYELLVPTMLVVTLCFVFSPRRTIHEAQVPNRFQSPAHFGDFVVDVLRNIRVRDVLKERPIKVVPPDLSIAAIMPLVVDTTQNYFPVVDREGRLRGVFSLDDIRKILGEEGLDHLLVADDLAVHKVIAVTPDETLDSVMRKFAIKNLDELPVIDGESQRFLGMLRRRDVIEAYNKEMYLKGFDQR